MNEWKKYIGTCKDQFYDLKLKNGRVINHCWPWLGNFNPVDGSDLVNIAGEHIDAIRLSHQQLDWTNPPF
jgi:hypothetical protein